VGPYGLESRLSSIKRSVRNVKAEIVLTTREFTQGVIVEVLKIERDGPFPKALVKHKDREIWVLLNELKIRDAD
jgi:hypothetical protein